jgi:hypothetical protein
MNFVLAYVYGRHFSRARSSLNEENFPGPGQPPARVEFSLQSFYWRPGITRTPAGEATSKAEFHAHWIGRRGELANDFSTVSGRLLGSCYSGADEHAGLITG